MPDNLVVLAAPSSQRPMLSVVMPHSMIVNGSVITSGGLFSAGCGGSGRQRGHDLLALFNLRRPMARADRVDADGPGIAVVEQRVANFLAVEIEEIVRIFPEAGFMEDAAELAHLAPEHAHGPMLDVEIVVFYVGEDRAGEAELALETPPGRPGRAFPHIPR